MGGGRRGVDHTGVDEAGDLASRTVDVAGPVPTTLPRLPRGTRLGRYVLGDALGEGGSGVVYAAQDPELDRKLAIKVVRPMATTQARLMREAQAMARLSHPNVVQVHDVGTFGDEVFVAMEYVDGWTLREWLALEKRKSRAILHTFVLAGRGLAAAHDAGFVHRDFKPDNVLVGRDGSVRVTDFGLARIHFDSSARVTSANQVVGTPGYMAPEQYRNGPPDPRSDQFGYCAALYEALYGKRPFEAETLEGIRRATLSGTLTPGDPSARIPAHVHRAIARGLALKPAGRFPTMRALLGELENEPASRWERVAVVAALAAAAGTTAGGIRARLAHVEELCHGADGHLSGVWDPTQKEKVQRAFDATALPYAESAFTGVAAQLDHFAGEWVSMRVDACRAARVRGEETEQEYTLRTECLDTRLRELASLVTVLTSADADVVRLAVEAGGKLSPVRTCGDIAALSAPVPPPRDARARAEVDALRARLSELRARAAAGRFAAALEPEHALLGEARGTGYEPLVAEALVDMGAAQIGAGHYEDAERTLVEAAQRADESHHDEARGEALVNLAEVTGRWLGHYARAAEYAMDAVSVARRVHDPRLESFALEQASREHGYIDDLDRALDEAHQSLVLTERFFGPDDLRRARVHSSASIAHSELARFDEARAEDEIALRIAERALGPNHPGLHDYLQDLAIDFIYEGRAAEAVPLDERAVDIVRAQLGTDHPQYANAMNNLAYAYLSLGRVPESVALNEEALRIWQRHFGPDHAENAYPVEELGEALIDQGRPAEALPLLERATRLAEANGIDRETVGDSRYFYGLALADGSHDTARATALVQRAIDAYGTVPRLAARRRRAEAWLASHGSATGHAVDRSGAGGATRTADLRR